VSILRRETTGEVFFSHSVFIFIFVID
jgi:hypothetical protein